jgi:hypothetical protein
MCAMCGSCFNYVAPLGAQRIPPDERMYQSNVLSRLAELP